MQDRNVKLPRSQRLPLELLPAFEAAARRLSFTEAGAELFLSQSAVSRQIQQLEAALGTPLFERRHRSLVLTEAGAVMQRAVNDSLERLNDAAARVRTATPMRQVAITCTAGFASLWLIPRLARFTASHPQVDVRISATSEMLDLERSHIDVAVRFVAASVGVGPQLFEEEVQPMCSPALLRDPRRPLKTPADMVHHTLLAVEMPGGEALTVDWEPWFRLMGLEGVQMAQSMRFTQYADAVGAAVAGQGIVIGRLPLLADLVKEGRLVAPFRGAAFSRRGYFVTLSKRAEANADARDFRDWLVAEAEQARAKAAGAAAPAKASTALPRPAARTSRARPRSA
ncbi:LysR substrate-binding domain-containing protein [Ramlibacter albus]|uniref:LysR family transcriptional regulator n=1 Tax=Ramlibacter albus TaxID=2079448 RepID=A0A923S1C2_9BURK|nr:LysR substrate-binding domain-containing protein [Ramlibacter albus]MBC5764269.1 LysR family transcriptional regulator [Ramlibacter albus]